MTIQEISVNIRSVADVDEDTFTNHRGFMTFTFRGVPFYAELSSGGVYLTIVNRVTESSATCKGSDWFAVCKDKELEQTVPHGKNPVSPHWLDVFMDYICK